jgi:hypothetical protein
LAKRTASLTLCCTFRRCAKRAVIDYKHGAGIAKEADCRQLKQYGAGVVYGLLADVPDLEDVTLVIRAAARVPR